MIILEQFKVPVGSKDKDIKSLMAHKLKLDINKINDFCIRRRSIDARYKPDIYYVYSLSFSYPDEDKLLKNKKIKNLKPFTAPSEFRPEDFKTDNKDKKIAVVGMGPAGLFCALCLAKAGFKPVLFERGKCVEDRQKDIEEFWQNGKLLLNSNIQFGEGGAGTFSDGKLNTLIKDKDGRIAFVLKTFTESGAKEEIIYDAKPHIGTDVLIKVVKNIRDEIIKLGGSVRFESQVTDIRIEDGELKSLYINDSERFDVDSAVFCIGHSARDTFKMLHEKDVYMEQKAFAVGFRVQHPQSLIDKAMYGASKDELPFYPGASPYKLAAKAANGRNVYSFCMCPGGYVVNASSEFNHLAINGMSYSGRNGNNANSAILINVDKEDFPSDDVLSGVDFQRCLENKAYELGKGKIPYCYFKDFTSDVSNLDFSISPEFKGECAYADLTKLLPEELSEAFVDGMHDFGRKIKGFDSGDCIVAGVESRSSSPVRITRGDDFQSLNIKGLYPCGEGAGYAGGIVSAAIDGIKAFEALL